MKQLASPPDLFQEIVSIKDHKLAPLLPSRSSQHTLLHNNVCKAQLFAEQTDTSQNFLLSATAWSAYAMHTLFEFQKQICVIPLFRHYSIEANICKASSASTLHPAKTHQVNTFQVTQSPGANLQDIENLGSQNDPQNGPQMICTASKMMPKLALK